MNKVKKAVLGALISVAVIAVGNANANDYIVSTGSTLSTNFASIPSEGGYGGISSPGSITWNFTPSSGGAAALNFELAGYGSLDGYGNCCTDTFSLAVNGNTIYSASFNLGGGGSNQVLSNPNNLTYVINATNNPTNDPTLVTYAGGVVEIAGPITLQSGSNSIVFSYNGSPQTIGDEGWGVNKASVAAVPEPETYAMLLAGLGLMGFMVRRKKTT